MEGPRPPLASEWPNLLSFLNENLRPKLDWSIDHEYPTALIPQNAPNIRIMKDGSRVISHAVLKPLLLKTPTSILKLGAVGSVVTDSAYRHQGLAAQIILDCLQEARRQDCDLAILWTDQHDYYRKLGFELAGFEESFEINTSFRADTKNLKFMSSNQISGEALLKLYQQHTVTSFRTSEDIRKFLSIPKTRLYTAWDAQGALVAYAVEGKGLDLQGYIHEWGGGVSKVKALLSWMVQTQKSSFRIILPHHSVNLIQALAQAECPQTTGHLGMLKIISPEQFLSKLNKAARLAGLSDVHFSRRETGYRVQIGNQWVEIEDERDFLRFIFGPATEVQGLPVQDQQKKNRLIPMPLWVWGWDSI